MTFHESDFLKSEKKHQAEWRFSSEYLTKDAKKPFIYRGREYHRWVLPVSCADQNLHQWIRQEAIEYFDENRIEWYPQDPRDITQRTSAEVDPPTNNLVSSQVQCVNCMFPFLHDPEGLEELLTPAFSDIDRILPIESQNQYIDFEWIGGSINYLKEKPMFGKKRRRGVGNTSADAVLKMQTKSGRARFVILEWKFTEEYSRHNKEIRLLTDKEKEEKKKRKKKERKKTYGPFLKATDCPINTSKPNSLEDDLLLLEPIYQITRHLLVAHEIKKDPPKIDNKIDDKIDEVVVFVMRSERNQKILKNPSPNLPQVGTVYDSMREILRDPGMLVDVTTESLFKPYHEKHKTPISKYLASRYLL